MTQASESESLDVLEANGPVAPDAPQLLVRQVSGPVGWLKRSTYEFRWHPEGRDRLAKWVRTTRNPLGYFPGNVSVIPPVWRGARTVLQEAWERGDPRYGALAEGRDVLAGWTRRQKVGRWVGVAAVVLLFAALTTFGLRALLLAPHETATAIGTVTRSGDCGRHGFSATATFTVQGRTYTAEAPCDAKVGSRVHVQYDPDNPRHSQDSPSTGYFFLGMAAICPLLLVPILRGRHSKRPLRLTL